MLLSDFDDPYCTTLREWFPLVAGDLTDLTG